MRHRIYLPIVSAYPPTKLGITVEHDHNDDVGPLIQQLAPRYLLDWSASPPIVPGTDSVAMFYKKASSIPTAPIVAGFNEPDRPDQANLTPREAAARWPAVEEAAASAHTLLSPAPSHEAIGWLRDFRNEYFLQHNRKPRLDGIAVHTYLRTAAEAWQHVVTPALAMAEEWDCIAGVWITEFNFRPSLDRSWAWTWLEAKTFMALCDDTPSISAYFWYILRPSAKAPGTWDGTSGGVPLFEYVPGSGWQLTWIGRRLYERSR